MLSDRKTVLTVEKKQQPMTSMPTDPIENNKETEDEETKDPVQPIQMVTPEDLPAPKAETTKQEI